MAADEARGSGDKQQILRVDDDSPALFNSTIPAATEASRIEAEYSSFRIPQQAFRLDSIRPA
jgi:hypothetical protein